MTDRPSIGQRVRVRGNTGIPGVAGRTGTVVGHHEDGVAVRVNLDIGDQLLCDPVNLNDAATRTMREAASEQSTGVEAASGA